ncbi:hypothetical protein Glove_655g8 [Diversispora epigaea]|uniref:Galactose oxidase n=1 Tax=Diversispora epigaea TaxID=1348612 RepID=A0A397G477_9GLOM|nr:hypothetical protein Glove_655g8 [Diversispora epigaea]
MYPLYKLFKFIFCTLLLINSILCFEPTGRRLHNSVIIEDRLLIFNGNTNATEYTSELFYLDLSKPFDNNNLTWILIPEGILPVYTWRSTAVLSLDNSTIYLIGGYMTNKDTYDYDYSNLVYTYNYSTSTWSIPKLGGDEVPPIQDTKGVIDNSGLIYIFGGYNATDLINNSGSLFNTMNILDTVPNTWTTLSISKNVPFRCSHYTANILPNGIIVYIGGIEKVDNVVGFSLVNMNEIKLFNTNTYEWSQMNATGDEIDPRWYFSSVLTPDGYIIIFGGSTYEIIASVSPKLAILDTNKDPFEWSTQSKSELNSPPSIYGHAANLYNDYMIITFGFVIDTNSYASQVYLYNIKSKKWVTTFIPPDKKTTTTTTPSTTGAFNPIKTPTKKSSKSLAIGLGIGIGAAFLISCIFITIFIVRKRNSVIIQIPGSHRLSS